MDELIDRVMSIFVLMRDMSDEEHARARERLGVYMETLHAAGRTDPSELSVYGLAYLREFQDGPAPQFTGC